MFSIFRKRKQIERPAPMPAVASDPVVDRAKERTHQAANNAKTEADRLNRAFTRNGITLTILKAAGGGHGH